MWRKKVTLVRKDDISSYTTQLILRRGREVFRKDVDRSFAAALQEDHQYQFNLFYTRALEV